MTDRTFSRPDGDFHYLDWEGQGPLALLSHATGFCARLYTPLAELLSPHLHLVGMDDRGHGRTTAEADPRRLRHWKTFAADTKRLLEHLGPPAILMGHSRGGMTGLMLAAHRPDLIRALILIDPTILPLSWASWSFLVKWFGLGRLIPIANQAARRKNGWPDKQAAYDSWQGRGPFARWREGFLQGYVEDGTREIASGKVVLACDPDWESRCFTTFCHYAYGYIKRLQIPTLVIYGLESDTFLPSAVDRFKRLAPGVVFHGLADTGHFVPMEKPVEVSGIIIDFLKTNRMVKP